MAKVEFDNNDSVFNDLLEGSYFRYDGNLCVKIPEFNENGKNYNAYVLSVDDFDEIPKFTEVEWIDPWRISIRVESEPRD